MKKSFFKVSILLLLFFGFPELLPAQTGYVSDMLFLTFREGPGESYAIVKRLKSDTPVSILEEQGDYYKVELDSKEVGWVDKRFINFEAPKIIIIETLRQENKVLENKILELEARLQSIQNQTSAGGNESPQKIKELEISLKRAMDENEALSAELTALKSKSPGLLKTDMIKWSLFGVGVLMLGWIFGHSVSISKRKGGSSLLG